MNQGHHFVYSKHVTLFNIYDEETILAVEGGFKSTLFDGRAQLNVSGFYYDYEDLQVFDNFIGSFGNLLIVLGNADQADYYGMEAELKTRLIDRLDLNFGMAYLQKPVGWSAPG